MRHSAPGVQVGRVAWLLLVLAAALATTRADAQAPAGARSVVRVVCRLQGGQESRGTGFVWRSPTSVVTALHVVAGCLTINVESEQKAGAGTSAAIEKVLREGDLALLKLDASLGLEPLKEAATVNLTEEHSIWGYPKDVRTMQGDDLRFSRGLNPAPTMEDVMSQTQYLRSIGDQGYPAWRARILRVSSTIAPGHSGAPIFDKAGLVVGMGDGGLYQGIQRINWAIPVGEYLQKLVSSTEPTRVQRGASAAHFAEVVKTDSAPVPEPIAADNAPVYAWSATIREILETADDEDRKEGEEWLARARQSVGADLGSSTLDIYEDPESGATAAVPEGVDLTFDPDSRMLEATSASGRVTLYIQIAGENGARSMESFWDYIDGLADWEPTDTEDEETDEVDGQRKFSRSREVTDANNQSTALLFSDMTLDDDGGFLGVAVAITDVGKSTKDDLRILWLFGIGANLSGFTID